MSPPGETIESGPFTVTYEVCSLVFESLSVTLNFTGNTPGVEVFTGSYLIPDVKSPSCLSNATAL